MFTVMNVMVRMD